MLELHDPALNDAHFVEMLACQVGTWAEEAFRTMVFGYKELTEESYNTWMEEYERVCEDPAQKELRKNKKPNRIDELQFQMENGLILKGATAIGGPYVNPHSYVISRILSVSCPMAA